MLMIALLVATAPANANAPADTGPRTAVISQASASVRILAGARITAGEVPDIAVSREAEVKDSDGNSNTVRLIEFP
jgi:hypothetical protein